MKLYAKFEDYNKPSVQKGIGSNERIDIALLKGNKVVLNLYFGEHKTIIRDGNQNFITELGHETGNKQKGKKGLCTEHYRYNCSCGKSTY